MDVEFDLYTGGTTTSKNIVQCSLFNDGLATNLAGIQFTPETKGIQGITFTNSGASGAPNQLIGIRLAATAVILPANSWVRIGISYNVVTRRIRWRGPGFNGGFTRADVIDTSATTPGTGQIGGFVTSHIPGEGNTTSFVSKFDNITATAKASSNLLDVTEFKTLDELAFTFYPNPVTDNLSVQNTEENKIDTLTISDLNGKTVKQVSADFGLIPLTDLSAGIYLATVTTKKGTFTRKIIKK